MRKGKHGKTLARTKVRRESALTRRTRLARLAFLVQRSWWVIRGVVAGLGAVALLYGTWLMADRVVRMPALSVRTILVSGCATLSAEEVVGLSGVTRGEPLLKLDLQGVRQRILRHPYVRDAAVARQLPDTLGISILERRPVAVIPGRDFMLVDQEGVVMAGVSGYPGRYPLITGVRGAAAVGAKADGALMALGVLGRIMESGLFGADRVSEVADAGDGRILVSLLGSGTVLVMTAEGAQSEIRRLGLLMESNCFDSRAAGYDLRFEGRVVKLPDRSEPAEDDGPAQAGGKRYGQG